MNVFYRNDVDKNYVKTEIEEQSELFYKMKNGDSEAREQIIKSCLPLVYSIANKFHYNNRHVDLDDLIQQGNIGLIKAVDNWDISKGTITTVATYYVRNALIDTIKTNQYNIKYKYSITKQAAKDIIKIKRCSGNTIHEISEQSGLNEKRVKTLMSLIQSKRKVYSKSTDVVENLKNHSETNINGCLADLISIIDDKIDSKRDKEIFLAWIKNINKINRTRLIASQFNISPEEVQSSIKNTKDIVRKEIKGD
jgi:RNA polymerase sigma factor (sigma-70 family)